MTDPSFQNVTDTTAKNRAVGYLFKQYRKKLINPATGKCWTLQEVSQEMGSLIRQHLDDGTNNEDGLSASAISRLENGSLLPGSAKLKLLAEFLQIPDIELKPLIDLGQKRTIIPDQKERVRIREMENKQHKTPLDWLRLISYANMASDYHNAMEMAEDALFVLDSSREEWAFTTILRALIQSKKAYAQYWLESKVSYLQRSREWAEHAYQELQTIMRGADSNDWNVTLIQIETIRSLTTAAFELFNHQYILHSTYTPEERQQLQQDYKELEQLFGEFESSLQLDRTALTPGQYQLLLELYLYFCRERDRLVFKWLETMEAHALWGYFSESLSLSPSQRLEQIPLRLYDALLSAPKRTLPLLNRLYQPLSGQLVFQPAQGLQPHWEALNNNMLQTLARHEDLADPNPNRAYQEAVLLYPFTAVRLGSFNHLVDLAYFQLIYMQTNAQTRPAWYYLRACCYALSYRFSGSQDDLERSLQSWLGYVHGELDSTEFHKERFASLLGEVSLWSTWLPLLIDTEKQAESPLVAWFTRAFEYLLKQPRYQRMRRKKA